MDDLFSLEVVGDRKLLQDFDRMPRTVQQVLKNKIQLWTERTRQKVVEFIESRLKAKTGRLARSVQVEVIENGLTIEGRVYIHGVPYAAIQDKGGFTGAHIIRPRQGKILAFMAATGDKVFATYVFHPGSVIPGVHFMRDASREMSPKITAGLHYELVQKLKGR